jgi:hypothetical protein
MSDRSSFFLLLQFFFGATSCRNDMIRSLIEVQTRYLNLVELNRLRSQITR